MRSARNVAENAMVMVPGAISTQSHDFGTEFDLWARSRPHVVLGGRKPVRPAQNSAGNAMVVVPGGSSAQNRAEIRDLRRDLKKKAGGLLDPRPPLCLGPLFGEPECAG